MGLFSDLIDLEPQRTIAEKAYEYCTSSSLSSSEYELINENKVDKEKYFQMRNVRHISMFMALFQYLESHYPKSISGMAHHHFQQLYWDYFENSGGRGYAMWDDQLEEFSLEVTGVKFVNLSLVEQNKFREQIASYQTSASVFFKKHMRKLTETRS